MAATCRRLWPTVTDRRHSASKNALDEVAADQSGDRRGPRRGSRAGVLTSPHSKEMPSSKNEPVPLLGWWVSLIYEDLIAVTEPERGSAGYQRLVCRAEG